MARKRWPVFTQHNKSQGKITFSFRNLIPSLNPSYLKKIPKVLPRVSFYRKRWHPQGGWGAKTQRVDLASFSVPGQLVNPWMNPHRSRQTPSLTVLLHIVAKQILDEIHALLICLVFSTKHSKAELVCWNKQLPHAWSCTKSSCYICELPLKQRPT